MVPLEQVTPLRMVGGIKQHCCAEQTAQRLDAWSKLACSLPMSGRRGAVDLLLLLRLHELTTDRDEFGCGVASQPHGLTREQCLAIFRKALEPASIRP